jgi:hypothetical protein
VGGYVYNPYRNPDAKSKVYLKKIDISRVKDVEGWLAGRPEFYVTAYGITINSDEDPVPVRLGSTLDIKFDDRQTQSQDLNNIIHDWSYFNHQTYYPALNIHAIEYDVPSANFNLTVTVNAGYKYNDEIGVTAVGKLDMTWPNKDKDCGQATLLYFENPDQVLELQNYGVRLTISD